MKKTLVCCYLVFVLPCCCRVLDITADDLKEHLLDDAFSQSRSHIQADNKETTRRYILDLWEEHTDGKNVELYLDPDQTTRDALSGSDVIVLLSQKFDYTSGPQEYGGVNYVLVAKGNKWGTSADRPFLLGAHYDSATNSPGTDDNASGMAALLEVADAFVYGTIRAEYTAIFVAFDFEEFGLTGSQKFVDSLLVPGILEANSVPAANFQAFILDTIMNFDETSDSQDFPASDVLSILFADQLAWLENNDHRGTFLTLIGRFDEDQAMSSFISQWDAAEQNKFHTMSIVAPIRGNDVPDAYLPYLSDLLRSDHANFWMYDSTSAPNGLKAVFLTDTADYRGYMKSCYHQPCDSYSEITPDMLDFLAHTTNSILSVMLNATVAAHAQVHPSTSTTSTTTTTTTASTTVSSTPSSTKSSTPLKSKDITSSATTDVGLTTDATAEPDETTRTGVIAAAPGSFVTLPLVILTGALCLLLAV